jgi:predicted extracellular nuclease
MISEVCDTVNSRERFLEIYNPTATAIDLTGWGVLRYSNGNTTSSSTANLTGMSINPGAYLIVAKSQVDFEARFGAGLNVVYSSAVDVNGDDVLTLEHNGVIIDVFGELGVDGTGQAWEYTNRCADRFSSAQATAAFDVGEWTFSREDDDSEASPGF